MFRPDIHLCLVHNTATANITPALDPNFSPKEVILLYSKKQAYQADCLDTALKPSGIKVSHWIIQDIRDIEHIRDRLLELMIEKEHDNIALNASGGTRPMSIAACEVFTEFNKPIFYVHPETDYVAWINRREYPSFNVADKVKLPTFLQAHGAEVSSLGERSGVPKNLRQLTQELIQQSAKLSNALSAINWLAQKASSSLKSSYLTEKQQQWSDLTSLLQPLANENLLTYESNRLCFKDEAARFFINGGWLETYTYSLIYGLRTDIPKIQDVGRSIELSRDSTGKAVKNELDVAFLHNNHLYIIECKTKRFKDKQTVDISDFDTPGAEALYKLDTLKWLLGGVRTKVMLVSYQDLSRWDKQRAHDLDIKVCATQSLINLEGILKSWIS